MGFSYTDFFNKYLDELKSKNFYRNFTKIDRSVNKKPYAQSDNKKVIIWCNNDYLGMSQNELVIKAACETIVKTGVGSGGTRNIAGTYSAITKLEEKIAKWYKKQDALIFTSGYVANMSTLETLGKLLPNCIFFSDEKNHNSIIKGITTSKADKKIFKHNDINDLEKKLSLYPHKTPKIIVFESVYSMDGSFSPIKEIIALAKQYNALTYIDEVHAIGLYGKHGSGVCELLGVREQIDIIQGNLAKGIGVIGGFISCSKTIKDFIRSFSDGFIFTTSLPPALMNCASVAIDLIEDSEDIRNKVHENSTKIKNLLIKHNFNVLDNKSHIIPLIVGNAEVCTKLAKLLFDEYNIYITPINYPTVNIGTERLRIIASPEHTDLDIDFLITALVEARKKLNF